MHFMSTHTGCYCQFLEQDLKTSLRRNFTFRDSDKVLELALRGGADNTLAGRQGIEHGIQMGRGSVWLNLTHEQYRKLRWGAGIQLSCEGRCGVCPRRGGEGRHRASSGGWTQGEGLPLMVG